LNRCLINLLMILSIFTKQNSWNKTMIIINTSTGYFKMEPFYLPM